ncbi:sensor domain-containing diguanylate cyclase [Azohydromonas aeria]|uniref:sensor domain-containing diguanylate cyclase n=1 Tax=Azohydromonas aeria TaxID=2590212 RepID=UPI0018DF2D5A|nr:diguanylate cyclase [Azohydromonas aeria]
MAIHRREGAGTDPAEGARLQALHDLHILDTPPEAEFDDLAWLAVRLCDAPIALVSLVDADRQWFKARCGLGAEQTPRAISFCTHAIESDGLFEIPDARQDPRFADNPLVTGAPHIRSYAGMPLVTLDGHRLGTLCVIDNTRPRTLDATQREALQRLARRAAGSLEARRQRLRAESREGTLALLLEAMPDAVVTCDATGLLGEFNRTARDWHGVDPRALPPESWAQHFDLHEPGGHELLATERIPLLRAWRGERVREAAIVIKARGQAPRTVLCNADPLRAADGTLQGAVCVMHDITDRLAAEERLRKSEQRMRTVADNMPALVAHVGADLRYRFVNRPYAQWFGLEPEAILGRHMSEILRREHYVGILPRLQQVLAGQTVAFDMDVTRGGELRHMHATYVPEHQATPHGPPCGQRTGFHLMVHDLTEKTQLARMLHERALTDALTGLPNRAAWDEEIQRGVARAQRAGVPATVMFLDLDGFKQVNDSFGHAAGDAVLCEFAHRLRGCLRRSDFIARLGGDEFVVLLDRITHPDVDPAVIAAKVLDAMAPALHVDRAALHIRPSIGIAVQPGPLRDATRLMQAADEAMYQAKRRAELHFATLEC